jgi:hypothetical protein
MIKLILTVMLFQSSFILAQESLVEAAKLRLSHHVVYDGRYQSIAYPNGDVDDSMGVCSDVVIRSYRSLGIDLQQLVHEDMQSDFNVYPKIWGLKKTDSNIDHRRVPNLETFFKRHGKVLPITSNPKDYKPGELVTWILQGNLPHVGIVSDVPSKKDSDRFQIIHNIGLGPQQEDVLFDYKIVGHFKYQ